jgi:hypothetical protein
MPLDSLLMSMSFFSPSGKVVALRSRLLLMLFLFFLSLLPLERCEICGDFSSSR